MLAEFLFIDKLHSILYDRDHFDAKIFPAALLLLPT